MANKFLESLIIGKEDKTLPKSRKQQFKKILKDNFVLLIKYSLFIFLFMIPFFVNQIIFSFTISNLNDYNQVLLFLYRRSFIDIFLILLMAIPISGVSYIIRKKVWNDSINNETVFTGIKKEIKRFLIIFFIIGISNFFFQTGIYYYVNIFEGNSLIKNGFIFINIIQIILVLMLSIYFITMEVRYNLLLKDLFKNSIKFTFRFILKNSLVLLIILIPWIIIYFILPIYQIIILFIILWLYFSLIILLIFEYTAHYYDEYVNKDKFTNIYKKGLQI